MTWSLTVLMIGTPAMLLFCQMALVCVQNFGLHSQLNSREAQWPSLFFAPALPLHATGLRLSPCRMLLHWFDQSARSGVWLGNTAHSCTSGNIRCDYNAAS